MWGGPIRSNSRSAAGAKINRDFVKIYKWRRRVRFGWKRNDAVFRIRRWYFRTSRKSLFFDKSRMYRTVLYMFNLKLLNFVNYFNILYVLHHFKTRKIDQIQLKAIFEELEMFFAGLSKAVADCKTKRGENALYLAVRAGMVFENNFCFWDSQNTTNRGALSRPNDSS